MTALAARAHAASPPAAEEADTILGCDAKISGYGGPELKATSLLGTTSLVTGSYRWVQGIQAASIVDGDVSGFAFGRVIEFGVF